VRKSVFDKTLAEHEVVVLRADLPAHGLVAGDVGTVVFVHRGGEAYEVEFMTAHGRTIAVETLTADGIQRVPDHHVLHARPLVTT
jgi:hypothetical protein